MVARHAAPRAAPRGPAAQRRAQKADRDGDVVMGLSIKGRAGVGKSSAPPTGPRKDLAARRAPVGILSASAQREILRKAGAGDVSMKEARISGARGGLVELKIAGWNKSKAADDADGGVSSLIRWLEKKASVRLGSRARSVKIKKSRVEGTDLVIKVAPEDVGALTRMNGYGWAGVTVTIEQIGGPVRDASAPSAPSSEAEKTKAMLRGVLERRYDFDTKLLNLSGLGQDEELKNQHIFDTKSTASKFFPAMMRVLEFSFDNPEERHAAITSVTLANNDLQDLTAVSTLSMTLPKLQNLDLSNNRFEKLSDLHNWRRRFFHLRHIILTGNPLEQNEADWQKEILSWYPNLLQINGIQMRTEEEIANKTKIPDLPFPIRSAIFQDEGGIAEQFVRTFFTGFDENRTALAAHYYDEQSEFSYAVNTQAPRDPTGASKSEPGEWESYLKGSRNLKKISQLPARQARKYRGTEAVANAFTSMPPTKHPDLAAEARKWVIEAKMVPGVPDVSGQSPTGVDGFLITVNGEFNELDTATGQVKRVRSFDRTFIVGPGGAAGVRIVSDLLTLRGYGGTQAFDTEDHTDESFPQQAPPAIDTAVAAAPGLPPGMAIEQAQQMVTELSKQTGMTVPYCEECLQQSGWDFQAAIVAFGNVRANLPAEAFVTPPV